MPGRNWTARIFERLLTLYPGGFRDEYGREMTLAFIDRYRNATGAGERVRVWLEALAGLAVEAPKEHGRMIREDLRYAVRTLGRNRVFAATIVLTLALGIGANTAIFSLLNVVTLRALPVPNPEQLSLLRVESRLPVQQRFSWPMFERLRSAAAGGTMAAMGRVARLDTRIGESSTEATPVQPVSGEYFSVLRVSTILGRPLTPQDNRQPGAHPVAVISHGYWQRQFGGRDDILGTEISLNGIRFTIVGVAGRGFSGVWLEAPTDVWIPLAMQHDIRYSQNFSADSAETRKPWMPQERIRWLDIAVRSAAGGEEGVVTALNAVFARELARMAQTAGASEERRLVLQQRLALQRFDAGFSSLRERFTRPLYILLGMAGLVLLTACANAVNLLLARAAGRQREIAVRQALGAGRLRLLQQLLTEGLLLVGAAALAAIAIARWAGDLVIRMATVSGRGPAPFEAAIDWRVLAFTAAVALATGLLFAVAPALRSTRVEVTDALKATARSVSGGAGSGQARVLVALQIAVSLVLVTGTVLLGRSFQNLLHVDLGLDQEHILSITINPGAAGYMPDQTAELSRRIIERLNSVPGVRSAALAMCGLLSGCRSFSSDIVFEGYQPRRGEDPGFLNNLVSADYFSTVGMRLLEGRFFTERDQEAAAHKVAVVNEALARRYFPGGRALGKRFGDDGKLDTEIVGIAGNARVLNVREAAEPMAFFPLERYPLGAGTIEVRTSGEPRQVADAVRRAIAEAEPRLPISRMIPLEEQVSRNLSQERLVLALTSAFGVLALGLASFGLFGVLSYAVARRTPELGVRIALGASRGRVIWHVVRDAVVVIAAGLAIGVPAVAAGTRFLGAMLFEVRPDDWGSLLGAMAALIAIPGAAALWPAWRASRVDPVTALRQE
ncbi:MAG: ABC transporter permease [Bryobacteraceae bacterium]|nr:ABC transporter permease [Bryobacteraceae bacterium]